MIDAVVSEFGPELFNSWFEFGIKFLYWFDIAVVKLFHFTSDRFQFVWTLFHLFSSLLNLFPYRIYRKADRIQRSKLWIFVLNDVGKSDSFSFVCSFKGLQLDWAMAHFGLFVRVFLLSFHQFLKTLNVRACAKIVHFLIFWIFVPNLPRAQILGMDFGKAMGKGFVKLGQILLWPKDICFTYSLMILWCDWLFYLEQR